MKVQYDKDTDILHFLFREDDEPPAQCDGGILFSPGSRLLSNGEGRFIGITILEASTRLAPPIGATWSADEVFAWIDEEWPGLIKMKVNQLWLREYLARLRASGVEIRPDTIPGLILYRIDPEKN
jgi:uncharacterized protein YuzE